MSRISVVGTGYVGLVTDACFAERGNAVVCVDRDEQRIETLRAGHAPFYEPDRREVIARNQAT